MTPLDLFHGAPALVIMVALLFTEEAGVPIPMAPGDVVLITGGVLIGSGILSPWIFFPAAMLAATAGAWVGYTWSRAVGTSGLRPLAARFGLADRLDRLERRLRRAGVAGVLISRLLVPGMRVYTTLLAGAVGISPRVFLMALAPSVVIWVGALTGLGIVLGLPLEHLLSRAGHVLSQGVEVLLVGVVGYLAARYAPRGRSPDALISGPGWERVILAALVDVTAIASMVAGADIIVVELTPAGGIDDVLDAALSTAVTILAYFLAARGAFGRTAGEALFQVSYRRQPEGARERTSRADEETAGKKDA